MSTHCAACYCAKVYCRKCKGQHCQCSWAKCPCGAKYGPYTCQLPKGHDMFAHRDGEVSWAPLQRWRANLGRGAANEG